MIAQGDFVIAFGGNTLKGDEGRSTRCACCHGGVFAVPNWSSYRNRSAPAGRRRRLSPRVLAAFHAAQLPQVRRQQQSDIAQMLKFSVAQELLFHVEMTEREKEKKTVCAGDRHAGIRHHHRPFIRVPVQPIILRRVAG